MGEGGDGGDRRDEQWTARVAEFTAELGCAHGLSETFRGSAGGQGGEAERGDETGSGADERGSQ
ncbi:hypothetical protein GCM10014715_84900 [Streptomyces spiralis]|uniref:Uncharacterized protein n=1 Tax=Streptomyces spiralis TaxID=66376 RepID=A0A919AP80_9ACTN|nr:hypothetical protein GCM10014715_84900 [Streptomyces spiralis]